MNKKTVIKKKREYPTQFLKKVINKAFEFGIIDGEHRNALIYHVDLFTYKEFARAIAPAEKEARDERVEKLLDAARSRIE